MAIKEAFEHRYFKWFLAAIVFAVTFYSRSLFVDTYYKYSFEADSEACVSVSKSFYNFFKSPSKETIPFRLSDYPPYQSGDFIFAGLTANVVRPLAKAGIITADIGDGDNSIIIFSMRWNSVIFQSIVALLVFLIVARISANYLFSFLLVLLYYILSPQILDFDLARIDHYYFFAAGLVIYFTIRLFKAPCVWTNYAFLGASVAMVMATKLNFPFYLVIVLFTMIYLIYTKKISWKNFSIAFASFLVMWLFLFQRWLFYPEEVVSTVKGIWQTGDDWVSFWGIKPYLYYHYNQFFTAGFEWAVLWLLLGWLAAFIYTTWQAVKRNDALAKLLVLTFIVQSLMLMIVPKVGRYGTVIPIWVCIFFAYSAYYLSEKHQSKVAFLLLVFVLPYVIPSYVHFNYDHPKKWTMVKKSIEQTRLAAYDWVEKNVAPGSVVAVYHPRISNPPIFELPISTPEKYLYYPFLYGEKAANFRPPSFEELEKEVNYVLLNNQYKKYHFWLLDNLIESGLEGAVETKEEWEEFYDSLYKKYEVNYFESREGINYGIVWYQIFTIDRVPKHEAIELQINKIKRIEGDSLRLQIASNVPLVAGELEIQFSNDPTFRWVDFASVDGFPSKYRERMITAPNFIPPKIDSLIGEGLLEQIGGGRKIHRSDINSVFRGIVQEFTSGKSTLDECIGTLMTSDYQPKFYELLNSIYGLGEESKTFGYQEYSQAVGYDGDIEKELNAINVTIPHKLVETNGDSYFRVRSKEDHIVYSDWFVGEIN